MRGNALSDAYAALTRGERASVYHYPTGEDKGRSRICTNDGIVPHAWEGYFASFGDIALKSGKSAAEARALYKSAQPAPTYGAWLNHVVIEPANSSHPRVKAQSKGASKPCKTSVIRQ